MFAHSVNKPMIEQIALSVAHNFFYTVVSVIDQAQLKVRKGLRICQQKSVSYAQAVTACAISIVVDQLPWIGPSVTVVPI